MSLSYERVSENDPPVARIISPHFNKVVYLNTNEKCTDNLLDSKLDEATSQIVVGKSIRELMYELSRVNINVDHTKICEINTLPNELISIIPSDKPENLLITGGKGLGKSSLTARYAFEYKNKFPERMIYLFTRMPDDIAYDGVELEEIVVNDDVKESGLVFEDMHNSLVIFDDMDNVTNKPLFKWVHALMDESITCGRKENIHVIYISHMIMDYKRTRNILNEADKVIFFNGMGTYQITDFLKRYAGLDKDQIKRILALEGWVCLSRSFPMYIIYSKGLFMLK
jgi:hypothetical protein